VEKSQSNLIQPLRSSIDQLAQSGVQVDEDTLTKSLLGSVEDPLRAAFAEGIKNVMIPAMESVTGQVLAQASDRLEQGFAGKEVGKTASKEALDSISKQLSTMTALVAELTNEVQSLRAAVAANQSSMGAVSTPPSVLSPLVSETELLRNEIVSLLQKRSYEAAFTKAVSASTLETTLFCCRNADVNDVLGGTTPSLSQPILLCLMQQLGAVLASSQDTNVQLALEWLQEVALSLNPADPNIQRHVPQVMDQVVANINQKIQAGDPALRRPLHRLLQVVRGMQMG
jgi:enhancer of mRNA-decapping protein 4